MTVAQSARAAAATAAPLAIWFLRGFLLVLAVAAVVAAAAILISAPFYAAWMIAGAVAEGPARVLAALGLVVLAVVRL